MSRARHKASGGALSSKPVWNAGGEQNAAKESEELKKGGRVHAHGEGEGAKARADKPKRRARGGKVESVTDMKHHSMAHVKPPHYRASGGRLRGEGTMSDKSPLTTAANVKHVTPGEGPESGVKDGGM
jgi:hypothetical protein